MKEINLDIFNDLEELKNIEKHKEEMLSFTIAASEINSDSYNVDGLNEMLNFYKNHFLSLNTIVNEYNLEPLKKINEKGKFEFVPLGKAIKFSKKMQNKDEFNNDKIKILLLGHMDTVFPKNHTFQKVNFINENIINGPGVADMKGGIAILLWALKIFEQTPFADNVYWEVLLTPDEEIGSSGSRKLLKELAEFHDVGLIFEPSVDEKGNFAANRKGSGDFTIIMRGKSAHAGRNFKEGRNAICALSKIILEIDKLNGKRDGVTINIGKITGGDAIGIVPDLAIVKIGIRYTDVSDEDWVLENIKKIVEENCACVSSFSLDSDSNFNLDFDCNHDSKNENFKAEIIHTFTKKPKKIIGETKKLYDLLENVGKDLNCKFKFIDTGGCCDGNELSAFGLPNIDSLGVVGGGLHTESEHMIIDSLIERLKITILLLLKLSNKIEKQRKLLK